MNTVLHPRALKMNFFCFRPGSAAEAFFDRWWELYQKFGQRDQLLVPFVLRELGTRVFPLLPPGQSVRDHPSFLFNAHLGGKGGDFERKPNGHSRAEGTV